MIRSLAHALLVLAASLTLACGDTDPDSFEPPPDATRFTLTAEGGTIHGTGPLDGVVLIVPAGSVADDQPMWMAPPPTDRPLPDGGHLVGPEIEFGPEPAPLMQPARLELPFDPTAPGGHDVEIRWVKVWRVGPDGWEVVDPAEAPDTDGRIVVDVETLDRFGAGVEVE